MPVPPHRPEVLRLRVFRGTRAVERGVLTPAQLRSTAWCRLRRDVYCDAQPPVTRALHARGVASVMPAGAAFGGLTAAMLWARTSWWTRARTSRSSSRRACGGHRGPASAAGRRNWRATSSPLGGACPGRHGCAPLWTSSGAARSTTRSCSSTGWSTWAWCRWVFDAQGFVARVDFAWPGRRLAVEYDGEWHGAPGQLSRDRRRLDALFSAGWRVIFVTAADMHRPEQIVQRILAALASEIGSAAASR